jgi:hypothetical protein
MFKGPTFCAWLELVVASRTDAALNDAVRAASVRFGERFREGLGALLDWPDDQQDKLQDLISIVFGQLEALALERVLFAPGEIDPPQFARALETAKRVSVAMVRQLQGPAPAPEIGGPAPLSPEEKNILATLLSREGAGVRLPGTRDNAENRLSVSDISHARDQLGCRPILYLSGRRGDSRL